VPISQGITLLLVGGGLTIFPALLPVGGKALVGSGATFGSLTDTTGSAIINSLSGKGGPTPKPKS
jgi:intracellular multiplication protein IcmD